MNVGPSIDMDAAPGTGDRSPYVADGQVIEEHGHRFAITVPAGLAVTDLAAQRLARRLHADAAVDVLVAPVAVLPAGTSARSDAEHRSLRPERPIRMPTPSTTVGCSVHRLDVNLADLSPARIGIDPDVVCQDLSAQPTTALVDAGEAGRPVFPRRALALLVVAGDDPALAELGRRWSNELIEQGIEARLAVAAPAQGTHLTAPCRPSAATVTALRPDVVVALDAAAVRSAPRWTAGLQLAEIHLDAADDAACETVSWRIGAVEGNLRYRVGPNVDVADLAEAIDRCCGLPPARTKAQLEAARPGRSGQAVSVLVGRRRASTRPRITSIELVGRPRHPAEAAWWDGLADQFLALGCTVDTVTAVAGSARATPDLRLWGGPPAVTPSATAGPGASTAGLAAVLLGQADLDGGPDGFRLQEAARRATAAVGAALTASPNVERLVRELELPVRRLPPFLGREHLRDLRAAATAARSGRPPLVGWHLAGPEQSPYASAVGHGLGQVLARHPDLLVETVVDGVDPASVPVPARRRRPATTNGPARDIADCRVQLWTPAVGHVDATGDPGRAVAAMLAAVPVVAAPADCATLGRLGRAVVAPTDPDDGGSWADAIERALRGDGPATDRTQIQARMLHGDQAAAVRGHRVLGWLLRGAAR